MQQSVWTCDDWLQRIDADDSVTVCLGHSSVCESLCRRLGSSGILMVVDEDVGEAKHLRRGWRYWATVQSGWLPFIAVVLPFLLLGLARSVVERFLPGVIMIGALVALFVVILWMASKSRCILTPTLLLDENSRGSVAIPRDEIVGSFAGRLGIGLSRLSGVAVDLRDGRRQSLHSGRGISNSVAEEWAREIGAWLKEPEA